VVTKKHRAPTSSVEVGEVRKSETGAWVVSGRLAPNGICPECGMLSGRRHGWRRRIEDFPAQGQAVWIELSVCRWRCLNSDCCRRRTFSDHDTAVAAPHARRTSRQAQLLGHMAHVAGGSPAERLLRRLGIRVARTLNRDIDAVRNAIELPWSNSQAEGQINRLKTLKRAMCGRAGPNLLRARMLPFHHTN
jgi:transposase